MGWVVCNFYCVFCDRKKFYFIGLFYIRFLVYLNISLILYYFIDDIFVLLDVFISYLVVLFCSSGGLVRNRIMFLVMLRFEIICIYKICLY